MFMTPINWHETPEATLPTCPACGSENVVEMDLLRTGSIFVCEDCDHDWSAADPSDAYGIEDL